MSKAIFALCLLAAAVVPASASLVVYRGTLGADDQAVELSLVSGADSVTKNCDDPYIQETPGAGRYALALVVWDNSTDGLLSDGFKQDGNPGFTCSEAGVSGTFCDVTTAWGTSRDADYTVAIGENPPVTSDSITRQEIH